MLAYACVTLLLIATAQKVSSAGCPDGWTSHHGTCYLYMRETYDWFNAKDICERLGGYLAEDTDDETHHVLSGLIESHGGSAKVWIGLQDFETEGKFMWTESKQPVATDHWANGEPNDDRGEGDCVYMDRNGWYDYNCEDGRNSFICQLS